MTQSQIFSPDSRSNPIGRIVAFLYGIVAYFVFFVTFLYAIGFVSRIGVPKTIDDGAVRPAMDAAVVNLILLSIFAVQHSVMARRQFKEWWTQFVPKSVERSTYVLLSSLTLALLLWQWRPIPTVLWQIDDPQIAMAVTGISLLGFLIALTSTFLINHFELFGLHQVANNLTGRSMPAPRFRTPLYYQFVRHPLYLGFIIAFWVAPTMTIGHLLFAGGHDGLHPCRHPARRARSGRSLRRRLSTLSRTRVDAGALAQIQLINRVDCNFTAAPDSAGAAPRGARRSKRNHAMIEDISGNIDYEESGAGPTMVLVPGSCSTGAAWRPVIAAWGNRFRCVTTSLPGYGGTDGAADTGRCVDIA